MTDSLRDPASILQLLADARELVLDGFSWELVRDRSGRIVGIQVMLATVSADSRRAQRRMPKGL